MAYIYDLVDTWNNAAVTFTAIKMNVTDTNSASGSLLMDLQVGGASRFNVNKTGAVNALADGSAAAPSLRLGATEVHGFYRTGGSSIGLSIAGVLTCLFASVPQGVGFRLLGNDLGIGFGATSDLLLTRRAAANLRLGAADTGATTSTVTITIAAPGVVTWSSHGFSTGTPVVFTTTGALPTGITAGTTYYAVVVDANTFQIASSAANAIAAVPTVITTSGTQSGTHTGTRYNITQRLGMQSNTGVTDRLGADLIIQGSQGTGTGAGGSIIFQVAPAGSSGTAQNALTTALTINSARQLVIDLFNTTTPCLAPAGSLNSGIGFSGSSGSNVTFYRSGSSVGYFDQNGFRVGGSAAVSWGLSDAISSIGTALWQDTANILALRNGTNAQTFRVYGSYTDASNYSRLAITGNSISSEVAGTGSLAITADAPVLNLAQTWNNSGVTFTGLKFNVTDTASAAGSLLMDLQVGGTSRFRVNKTGDLTFAAGQGSGTISGPTDSLVLSVGKIRLGTTFYPINGTGGFLAPFANSNTNNSVFAGWNTTGLTLASGFQLGWSNVAFGSNFTSAALDTILTRRGPANLRLGAADDAGSAISISSVASQQITLASNHSLSNGAAVQVTFTAGGAVPAGTAVNTTYYARSISAAVLELYDTYDQALNTASTTGRVAVTTAGTTAFVNRATPFQTLSVQSFTGTDIPGQPFVITGSQGTGTGAGGSIIFQVAPAGSTGSAQNALATALTIDGTRVATFARGANFGDMGYAYAPSVTIGDRYTGLRGTLSGLFLYSNNMSIVGVSQTRGLGINQNNAQSNYNGSFLIADDVNTLALRDANNGQIFRIYGRFTDITNNFERFFIRVPTTSGDAVQLGTQKGATTGAARALEFQTDGTTRLTIGSAGGLTLADAQDIAVGSTTGTKIATANTQKLGFWNATPIVQPNTSIGTATTASTGTGDVVAATTTFDGYTIPQIVKALRDAGLLA